MTDILTQLQTTGRDRNIAWRGGAAPEPLFSAVELAGEIGEACNIVKKLDREARAMPGSRSSIEALADELADGIICIANLANDFAIDLPRAVAGKFNATSDKHGFPHRLEEPFHPRYLRTANDGQPSADIESLGWWAESIMNSRRPDFVIGDDYLRRWWVIPRNPFANVYLHQINRSDDDRALHDHPWANVSVLLKGGYREHLPDGEAIERKAGDVVQRQATDLHRLELIDGQPAVSLFITGPKVRDWGFACPNGWVPWQIFTGFAETGDSSTVGRGCGE